MTETRDTDATGRILHRHRNAIIEAWARALRALPESHYHARDPDELREWAAASFDSVVDRLSTGSTERLDAHVKRLGRARRELGFEVGEVVEGILLLEPVVRAVLTGRETLSDEERRATDAGLSGALRQYARQLASEFAAGMRRSLETERGRTQALLEETRRQLAESQSFQEVVTAALDKVGPPAMVEIVGRGARELTGAGGAAVVLAGPDGSSSVVLASGSAGSRTTALAARCDDLVNRGVRVETGVTLGEGPAASLLTLPLRSGAQRIGAVVLLDLPPGFGEENLRVARVFADQAAVAIAHEQLHSRSERMAVLEERQKLARELHDSATQSIYGVSMYAEAANRMLETGDREGAAAILGEIRETALDALREMRLLIYELRPKTVVKDGLAAAIEARLTTVERRSGLQTEFVGEEIGSVPREVAEGLHGIAREALNNVMKHAHASTITVRLSPGKEGIRLEIEDDGVGFDLEETRRSGGLGLAGMEERAVGLGGRVVILSRPGRGTRVRVSAPGSTDESHEEGPST